MRLASVNQDPGVAPGRAKGAAVHLAAMRAAFRSAGAEVVAIDGADPFVVAERLSAADAVRPLDLVYERYALGRAAAARFAAGRDLPFVVEVNAPLADEASRWRAAEDSALLRAEDRFLFAEAHLVLAVSRAVAEYAIQRGARPEAVEVVANGVDAKHFARRRAAEHGGVSPLPGGRFVIGFHGRLRPWHGFDLLVAACEQLIARGVDLHLLAVGEGEFAQALAGRVPEDRVTVLGWRPHEEVGRWVALFDVLPLTYPAELPCYFSPLKLVEAMAAGAVPVVPAQGDLEEIVGGAGVVYPPGDLGALVDALEKLAREPERRHELGRLAVIRAGANSWSSIAERVLARAGVGRTR